MHSLNFLEEVTEQQESSIQGGLTLATIGGETFAPFGLQTRPWGGYASFPLAASFPSGIDFGGGFRLDFFVAQMSDQPTGNILSGPFGSNAPNGLAGIFGLRTSPFFA